VALSGKLRLVSAAAAVAAVSATVVSGEAFPWSSWTTIHLEARAMLLFAGHAEMSLSQHGGRRFLETQSRATFLGAALARTRTRTTIDLATGDTLEYWELSKEKGRRYTFGPEGYVVERLRPTKGHQDPVEGWETTSRRQYAYPLGADGARVRVFDYYGMILHLREAALARPGDEVVLHVATSRGPRPYRIRVGEERRSKRRVRDLATGRPRTLEVRELRLRISPAETGEADEGFLKMEGETEIWVEADTRTLLEVDGKIPKVPGRVELAIVGVKS
jgi:hypothetical protein